MTQGLFITGTDTEVGKTVVTCGLLRVLTKQRYTAVGMKPVATGAQATATGLRNSDAEELLANSNPRLAYNVINPFVYAEPTAPNIAAGSAEEEVTLEAISTAYAACAEAAEFVLLEGLGGWRVPLSDSLQTVDLVHSLRLPAILVCGLRLGCINHALLTAAAIAADGVPLLGWVANSVDPGYGYQRATIATLKARIAAPLIGITAWHDPLDRDRIATDLAPGGHNLWP
ncbi:MAG TPA: dethiobiotin synthase [Gammaproteobacteria bacterium]|nr:dethiobiotin synthase [Gammaproteobacteria bacterium]